MHTSFPNLDCFANFPGILRIYRLRGYLNFRFWLKNFSLYFKGAGVADSYGYVEDVPRTPSAILKHELLKKKEVELSDFETTSDRNGENGGH